ncbi:MAG: nitroreductase family protein [Candidatus Riflebacteria bacterium]|nr:nitroreductase family protein [Candidatus Riflebacteria bacterium]
MKLIELLKKRRSYYAIDDNIKVSQDEIIKTVEEITALIPDAFNSKSQYVVLALGEHHKKLWDAAYDAFGGKVAREKIDSFKAGAGTILFFSNTEIVKGLEEKFPRYKENFKPWSQQANAMLQINIWTALREMGLGASLQHYNPVIDKKVREMFQIEPKYQLLAQMVFGNILEEPAPKGEDTPKRVKVFK